jgi:phage major head subunit gpT-like protein
MILNKTITDISTGVQTQFAKGMMSTPEKELYKRIAMVTTSTNAREVYKWLTTFPRIREWLGDRHIGNLQGQELIISNKKWESTLHLMADEIEDGSWQGALSQAELFGEEVARFKNELVFKLLQGGFAALSYDNATFFSVNHPTTNAAGATVLQSNLQAGAGNPWYLMTTDGALKPFILQMRRDFEMREMTERKDEVYFMRDELRWGIDGRMNVGYGLWQYAAASQQALNAANFDALRLGMMALTGEGGMPLGLRPNVLIVGRSNYAAAIAVVKNQQIAVAIGTGGTAIQNPNYNIVDVIEVPWLP